MVCAFGPGGRKTGLGVISIVGIFIVFVFVVLLIFLGFSFLFHLLPFFLILSVLHLLFGLAGRFEQLISDLFGFCSVISDEDIVEDGPRFLCSWGCQFAWVSIHPCIRGYQSWEVPIHRPSHHPNLLVSWPQDQQSWPCRPSLRVSWLQDP